MDTNFYQDWQVRKPAVRGGGGVVTSHFRAAAEAGADVLRAGGNAMDAAVAASFAISVIEPWMSGPGGCGFMLVYKASGKPGALYRLRYGGAGRARPGGLPTGGR